MGEESPLSLVLWATDIPALATFLQRVGGMRLEGLHPGFATLVSGPSRIVLHADDEADRRHPWYQALRREGVARGIGSELRLRVTDVDAAYREALRLGGLGIVAPTPLDDSVECQVMGPDGYLFSLWAHA
jgi:hypothetical protein